MIVGDVDVRVHTRDEARAVTPAHVMVVDGADTCVG
jgi:hypothetical protein